MPRYKELQKDKGYVNVLLNKPKRGRPSVVEELGAVESFRRKLDNCSPRALDNIVKGLYDIAVDRSENVAARIRASEIILAYSMGKPTEIPTTTPNQSIVFVRAEPILQNRIEQQSTDKVG